MTRRQNAYNRKQIFRARTRKLLTLQALESRQLFAANVLDDVFQVRGDAALNILANDTSGSEVQNVSAFQMGFDPASVDEATSATNWFVPERPGQPGVPQRSLITGAVFGVNGGFGNVNLLKDSDSDPSNDAALTVVTDSLGSTEGIVLPMLRDNSPVDSTNVNLGVLSYRTDGGGPAQIWSAAAPENSGSNTVPFSGAYFPYSAGWLGGSWSGNGSLNSGGTGISVELIGSTGTFEAEVAGVSDSYEDGFLFAVASQGNNDDNYARTRPIGGGKWAIQVRDNAAPISSAEGGGTADHFNLLYIPRGAQGLIGGRVDGTAVGTSAVKDYSSGEFTIEREVGADGLWRLSIPGHDITSGVLVAETNDLSVSQPRNSYFSYDDAGDGSGDILIRQFAWTSTTETPLNTDFNFFFIPFENSVNVDNGLSIVPGSIGDGSGNAGVTTAGNPVIVNADGTVQIDVRQYVPGDSGTDTFVYKATDGLVESVEATVTVTWVGVNDAPVVISPQADLILSDSSPAIAIDLTSIFQEFDNGDSIASYEISTGFGSPVTAAISGTDAIITPVPGAKGATTIKIVATDTTGLSTSIEFKAGIFLLANDSVNAPGSITLNVLANDTAGSESPSVSAFQVDFDPASVNRATNATTWLTPERPGQPGVPQRSIFAGAAFGFGGNFGDVDVVRDNDDDPTNDASLTIAANGIDASAGLVLPMLRDNTPVDATTTNLGVISYETDAGGRTWVAILAGPENNGENTLAFSGAFFPYSDGWVGGSWDASLNVNAGGAGMTVTGAGGRYEAVVSGVTDSYNEGFLFSVAGDNDDDNYGRTRPIDGGKWAVQIRDNAAELSGAEGSGVGDDFNLLYIPRASQGLIGGIVDASESTEGAMSYAAGDFSIQRQSNGFWRVSIPGHDINSGVIVAETYDLTSIEPRNSYFSYDDAGDGSGDIIIRQFAWNSNVQTPLNTDFVFFFIPFENTVNSSGALTLDRVDAMSTQGVSVTANADGTVNYNGLSPVQVRALPEGTVLVDTFTYDASANSLTDTATVTITIAGANDAPEVVAPIPDIILNEGGLASTIDLAGYFIDVDTGDSLDFTVDGQQNPLFDVSLAGTNLTVTPSADLFGTTTGIIVTVTDQFGGSVSTTISVAVIPVDTDGVVAVDDTGSVTDKVTPVVVSVLSNDYHPDTTAFSVSAAEIFGNPEATGDIDTVWSIVNTTAAPNALTVQSAPNRGDVEIGRNGNDLFQADGVLLGTVRDNTSPYQTVNTYAAFSSYGFATGAGIGAGERNSPLNAAFFPFAEGWTGGHIAADGTLLGGVGISQANIVKVQDGLFEITIPEAVTTNDGFLFAMSGANDDNVVSVYANGFDNKWLVRQVDSDSDQTGFKNGAISFVYVPTTTTGLIGGVVATQQGQYILQQQYGSVSVDLDNPVISFDNYTSAQGALIAIATTESFVDINGVPTIVPAAQALFATPQGDDFRIDILNTLDYSTAAGSTTFQFIFLPYNNPLERVDNLNFNITSFDAVSANGAAISLADGVFTYDPSGAGAPIADLLSGQSLVDTFTYTVTDGRGATSTAMVSITVQGENQDPTAADDVINLNELSAQSARLTVLRNDVDPDVDSLLGPIAGIAAANLAVDASSVWTVSETGAAPNNISVVGGTTGNVEVQRGGAPINPSDGVVLAMIRENFDGANTNYRLVQAYDNGSGGTSLALRSFGVDGAADADVSLAYFPFGDNWVAGHVNAGGSLTAGSGASVTRTAAGRYEVQVPGLTDAAVDGFLFVIGNENADNVVQTQAIPGTDRFNVAVRDNQQDFANGEDGGFSFVFVPRNTQNLVAGTVDPSFDGLNAVTLAIGEFDIVRQEVLTGGVEYKLTIPGQSPSTGMLVLTNQDNSEIEDNFLTYQDDGTGSFVIRSHDMPSNGRQDQPFTFAFIPFGSAAQPEARPVPGLLSIDSVDATSSLGATLSINPDGTILYQPGTIHDALYVGDIATDTFSYTMTDGFGGTSSATVTVNVYGFGASPELVASSGATYYGMGDVAVGIDGQLNLVPVGVPFFDGATATVALTSGSVASDVLAVRDGGDVTLNGVDISYLGAVVATFTNSGGTLGFTFNAAATEAAVEAILRSVTFFNADPSITVGSRTATFTFTDGNAQASEPVTKDLELGLKWRRTLQQGLDLGFGVYTGTQDATIRELTPNAVISPPSDHLVDFDATGNASQVVLRFDDLFGSGFGQIPVGATITSANLFVETNPNTSNASGQGATIHRMLTDWDDATATWSSFGGGVLTDGSDALAEFESAIHTASGAGTTGTGVFPISVLPDLRAWSGGETNYGWVFTGWAGRTDGWFFSTAEDETPTSRPKLEIEFLPPTVQAAGFREGVNGYAGTVDTQIVSSSPDVDNSAVTTLFIDSPTTKGLVRFDDIFGEIAGQVPAGARVVSARLRLASTTSNAQGDGARLYPMLTPWSETDTFNSLVGGVNADGAEAADTFTTAAGNPSLVPNVQGGWHDFDVTTDVQAWVLGELDNNGWLFDFWDNGTDGWGFQSSEAAAENERPRLEIFYTTYAAPEVNVVGNDLRILSGDTTPNVADDTNFGNASAGTAAITRTFTIENRGDTDLDLTGNPALVQISGSSDFTISAQPASDPLLAGTSTTFEVTFTPTTQGLQTATITIASNDEDETLYPFDLQGNVQPPLVTLAVTPEDIAEAGGVASVTATLSAVTTFEVQVNLTLSGTATSGVDYSVPGLVITIPAGSLTGSINVTAINDSNIEGNETIVVDINTVANAVELGQQQVTVNIVDDDNATPPAVESVSINGGDTTRSNITNITVAFDTEIDHAQILSAFTLTNIDTNQAVGSLVVTPTVEGGKTIVVLTFGSGLSVIDRVGTGMLGNSLADGNYRLDILAGQVRAVTGSAAMLADYVFGGQTAGQPDNDDFFRLYGDESGDGFVDGLDFNEFLATFANPSNFNGDFDSNGDGFIDGSDLNDFLPAISTSRQ